MTLAGVHVGCYAFVPWPSSGTVTPKQRPLSLLSVFELVKETTEPGSAGTIAEDVTYGAEGPAELLNL